MIFRKRVPLQKYQMLLWFIILFQLSVNCKGTGAVVNGRPIEKRGIMDNINNGIKYAGQMLGVSTASDVADLVVKAFQPTVAPTKKQDYSTFGTQTDSGESSIGNTIGLFNGVLRLIGLDSSKLGALAVNGIIFIAQMIGNALTRGGHSNENPNPENTDKYNENQPRMENGRSFEGRSARSGSPMDWMMENPSEELLKILETARDKKLPEYLAEAVNNLEQIPGDGDCTKLLLCKSAPIVWGMQRAVFNQIDNVEDPVSEFKKRPVNDRFSYFFQHLPDVKEYKEHGHQCEERYAKCSLNEMP